MPNETETVQQTTTSQQELTELLAYIRQQTEAGVEGAKTLVGQQAPLVVKEIVAYERAQATSLWVIPIVLATAAILLWKKIKAVDEYDKEHVAVVAFLVSVVTLVAAVAITPCFLKAWFAPRLVVLDYISHLL